MQHIEGFLNLKSLVSFSDIEFGQWFNTSQRQTAPRNQERKPYFRFLFPPCAKCTRGPGNELCGPVTSIN